MRPGHRFWAGLVGGMALVALVAWRMQGSGVPRAPSYAMIWRTSGATLGPSGVDRLERLLRGLMSDVAMLTGRTWRQPLTVGLLSELPRGLDPTDAVFPWRDPGPRSACFDMRSRTLWLDDHSARGRTEPVLVHELLHALDAQYEGGRSDPRALDDLEVEFHETCLAEGRAEFVRLEWEDSHPERAQRLYAVLGGLPTVASEVEAAAGPYRLAQARRLLACRVGLFAIRERLRAGDPLWGLKSPRVPLYRQSEWLDGSAAAGLPPRPRRDVNVATAPPILDADLRVLRLGEVDVALLCSSLADRARRAPSDSASVGRVVDPEAAQIARGADGAVCLDIDSASHGRARALVVAFPHAGAARDFHAWAIDVLRGGAGLIRPAQIAGMSPSPASASEAGRFGVEEGDWGASVVVKDDQVAWAEWSRPSARFVADALSLGCVWGKNPAECQSVPAVAAPAPRGGVAQSGRGISWSPPPGWDITSWSVEGASEPFAVARRGRAEVYLSVLDASASLPGLREFAKWRFGIHGPEAFVQTVVGSWRGLIVRVGLPDGLADLRLFSDGVRVFVVSVRAPRGEVPDDPVLRRLLEGVRSMPGY